MSLTKLENHADYNNNHPNSISFMTDIAGTSGSLHSALVRLLFLQAYRETDRFFAASGVQLAQSECDQFHYKSTVFSSQLKSKVGSTHKPLGYEPRLYL